MDILRTLGVIALALLCSISVKAETSVGDRHDLVNIDGSVVFMQQPSLQVGGFDERIAQLGRIDKVAVDRLGNFYALDDLHNIIKIWSYYTLNGEPLEIISDDIIQSAGLRALAEVRAISAGARKQPLQATRIYLLDQDKNRTPESRILMRPYLFSQQWIQLPFTEFQQTPHALTVDVSGRLIVSEDKGIVEVLIPNGSRHDSRFADEGVLHLEDIDGHDVFSLQAVDTDDEGNIYVADSNNGRVIKLDPHGNVTRVFGSRGDGRHQFRGPIEGIAVDWRGNVYGLDGSRGTYAVFSPDGRFLTRLGKRDLDPHQQKYANEFVIDKISRRFIIADKENYQISIHEMTRGHFISRIYTHREMAKLSALHPTSNARERLPENKPKEPLSHTTDAPASLRKP